MSLPVGVFERGYSAHRSLAPYVGGSREPGGLGGVVWAGTFLVVPLALGLCSWLASLGVAGMVELSRQEHPFLEVTDRYIISLVFVCSLVVSAWVFYEGAFWGLGFRQRLQANENTSVGKEIILVVVWSSLLSFPALLLCRCCSIFSW